MLEQKSINENKSVFYPPGGILIWLIMMVEIITFLGGVFIFMYYRNVEVDAFAFYRSQIHPVWGTVNTIVLITSGYFMANAIVKLKLADTDGAVGYMGWALFLGILFLMIKAGEYYLKLEEGFGMGHDTFFTLYWLMTGFHFIHVLFGVGLLAYMRVAVKKRKYSAKDFADVEASGTYWHMCDLIWILIFPILYLI
ncbi:cytochrome c oxidase subunit 3 [bacterium SCSIO 12643]|nr:cytochrome c oxidase subunit 3 [bacterium SCSIO 12643]